jgi:hypothetical protein
MRVLLVIYTRLASQDVGDALLDGLVQAGVIQRPHAHQLQLHVLELLAAFHAQQEMLAQAANPRSHAFQASLPVHQVVNPRARHALLGSIRMVQKKEHRIVAILRCTLTIKQLIQQIV